MLQSHCLSRFGQSAIEGKYDQRMLWSEYAVAQIDLSLRLSHKTFCKPIDCRRYIRLAKALIRLLMCRLRVCRLIRLFLHHRGVQLILAYSWARPAILVVGKGRGGMFLFLLFLHFHSCSPFFPVPLFHLLYSPSISFLPFSGRRHKMTLKGWRVVKPQHNQSIVSSYKLL